MRSLAAGRAAAGCTAAKRTATNDRCQGPRAPPSAPPLGVPPPRAAAKRRRQVPRRRTNRYCRSSSRSLCCCCRCWPLPSGGRVPPPPKGDAVRCCHCFFYWRQTARLRLRCRRHVPRRLPPCWPRTPRAVRPPRRAPRCPAVQLRRPRSRPPLQALRAPSPRAPPPGVLPPGAPLPRAPLPRAPPSVPPPRAAATRRRHAPPPRVPPPTTKGVTKGRHQSCRR